MRSYVPSYNKDSTFVGDDNTTQHSCTLRDTSPLFLKPTYTQYSKSSAPLHLPSDEALAHSRNLAAEVAS